jgi:hypothetical protein
MGVPYHEVGVKRLSALVCLGGLAGLVATACVYDPDDRCGPHQEPIDNDRCVCEAGYVPGDATYCEVFQENICLVPCSAGNTDVCFVGEVCCNFVLFEPICVPADACAPNGTVVE